MCLHIRSSASHTLTPFSSTAPTPTVCNVDPLPNSPFTHGRIDWFDPFDLSRRDNPLLGNTAECIKEAIAENYPAFEIAFRGFTGAKLKHYTHMKWEKVESEEGGGGGGGGGGGLAVSTKLKELPRSTMDIRQPVVTTRDQTAVDAAGRAVIVKTPYKMVVSPFLFNAYMACTIGDHVRGHSGAGATVAEVRDRPTHPPTHPPTCVCV